MNASEHTFKPGELLGEFTILCHVGRGGYGDVFYVKDSLGKNFALKLIREDLGDAIQREISGISLLRKQIHSSDVLPLIYHVGKIDGRLYYTMDPADNCSPSPEQYLPDTLQQHLKNSARFSAEEILNMAEALLHSINALHEHGLVHRDIKPSNIIRFQGKWMLTDFGLLSATPKTFVGSPGFLAPFPENGITLQTEKEADLYSLGKVIYCAFSGESVDRYPLLPASYDLQEMMAIKNIFRHACAQNPSKRFHSCQEFREAIQTERNKLIHGKKHKGRHLLLLLLGICCLVQSFMLWRGRKHATDVPVAKIARQFLLSDAADEGIIKLNLTEDAYHILCCFPCPQEDGVPTSRANQQKAMDMVKQALTQYMENTTGARSISLKHAAYLQQPFRIHSLLFYIYSVRFSDCIPVFTQH